MAQCSKCKERKAKRHCPALGDELCNLCCGLLRGKKIHCPRQCIFLGKHKTYQEEKLLQKKQAFVEDILDDERLMWLILHIEAALKDEADRNPKFTDRDAVLSLEYAVEKVRKGVSRLILTREERHPRNETGEAVLRNVEDCRFRKSIILVGSIETYTTEEKLKCLENVILTVKYLARGGLEGRKYLQALEARFAKIENLSKEKKLITPSP